jgi:uncharacterized membrane protein
MNPFDWRNVLLAKHAQHVVLIHFPIALFIVAVALDIIGQWSRKKSLLQAAYYNLTMAAASTLPVIVTGLAAWQWQLEGQPLKGVLLYHLLSGVCASVLIWSTWWIHFRAQRHSNGVLPRWRIALELAGVLIVGLSGHLGGFLSGVNS